MDGLGGDLFTQTIRTLIQRKVKWLLEHLGALWIMGEMANISDKTFKKRSLNEETRHVQINDTKWHENSNFMTSYFLSWEKLL